MSGALEPEAEPKNRCLFSRSIASCSSPDCGRHAPRTPTSSRIYTRKCVSRIKTPAKPAHPPATAAAAPPPPRVKPTPMSPARPPLAARRRRVGGPHGHELARRPGEVRPPYKFTPQRPAPRPPAAHRRRRRPLADRRSVWPACTPAGSVGGAPAARTATSSRGGPERCARRIISPPQKPATSSLLSVFLVNGNLCFRERGLLGSPSDRDAPCLWRATSAHDSTD